VVRFESRFVMKMELQVLAALDWRVSAPTSVAFLEHFLRSLTLRQRARRQLRAHARSAIRRTLAHGAFLRHRPSALAAAALHHALRSTQARLSPGSAKLELYPAAQSCLSDFALLGPAWAWGDACPPLRRAPAAAALSRKTSRVDDRESPSSTLDAFEFGLFATPPTAEAPRHPAVPLFAPLPEGEPAEAQRPRRSLRIWPEVMAAEAAQPAGGTKRLRGLAEGAPPPRPASLDARALTANAGGR
jgi:hypothetical protein